MECPRCGYIGSPYRGMCPRCIRNGDAVPASTAVAADGRLFTARGVGGQVELDDNLVRISRRGHEAMQGLGLTNEREFFLSQITGIRFNKPNLAKQGFIQFFSTDIPRPSNGSWSAGDNENTVMFTLDQMPAFERLKNEIERRINRHGQD